MEGIMPIKIQNSLPATKILESENIFVMTEDRAMTQDIRPLKIIILNLMPTKIETETQLLRLLGNLSLIHISFCAPLFLLLPHIWGQIFTLRPVYEFHFLIYFFCFLLYTVGLVMQGYSYIPFYDKFAHTLSGVFFTLLGVIFFYPVSYTHLFLALFLPAFFISFPYFLQE